MDQNNLMFVKQYFSSNGHIFNKDTKIAIKEKIEKYINMKSVTKKRKKTNGLKSWKHMCHLDLKWNLIPRPGKKKIRRP